MRFRYNLDILSLFHVPQCRCYSAYFARVCDKSEITLRPQERRNNARASHDNGIGKTGLELSADGFVHESGFLLAQEIRGTKMPEPLSH